MAAQQQHQQLWLKDMDFSQQDLQLLLNQNIHNARDLLVQSPIDLVERLNIPLSQAQRILQHTAMQVAPPYVTAMELHSTLHMHSVKLLTGLPALDNALRIGVPPAAITELVGPASVGKSQFCYTLTLQAALPQTLGGLAAPVLYIDTEGKFSSDRIREMIIARLATAPASTLAAAGGALNTAGAAAAAGGAADPTEDVLDQTLNRVLIVKAHTPEELNAWLNRLSQTVAQRDVKLIVLDSIAALLRTEFGGAEAAALAARGEMLGQQAALLKAVAEANRIPVVVTNQVTARMTGPAVHSFQQPQSHIPAVANAMGTITSSTEGQVSAALGTKWAHAVNVRLVLERRGNSRVITIAKSPLSANVAVEYTVTSGGVQQAPDMDGHAAVLVAPHSALDLAIANAPIGVRAASLAAARVLDGTLQQWYMALEGSTPVQQLKHTVLGKALFRLFMVQTLKSSSTRQKLIWLPLRGTRMKHASDGSMSEIAAEAPDAAQATSIQLAKLAGQQNRVQQQTECTKLAKAGCFSSSVCEDSSA